jgi:ATP-binding cassette subfamily F protein 2
MSPIHFHAFLALIRLRLLSPQTNHLDIEAIDSLADAVNKFNGGMVLVSHDFR